MKKQLKELFKLNKEAISKNKPVKITNLTQYRKELEKGTTDFDFSELNVNDDDIQNINLENLNLDIDLREVFVPFNGSQLFGKNVLLPIVKEPGDSFLNISNSRLAGNNVSGSLEKFVDDLYGNQTYIWYSEETFDDEYKSKYPQFFLSKDAPEELRQKYYNPIMVSREIIDLSHITADSEENRYIKIQVPVRQTLTIDEYLKYYEFLKGKYLGNFYINEQDLLQIDIIERYGLERREEILSHIKSRINIINQIADCENYNINEISDKDVCLSLKLRLKKEDFKEINKLPNNW